MTRLALALVLLAASTGCTGLKAKNRSIFCVGVCMSTDTEMDKKKGEDPKDLAPCPDGQFRAEVWDIKKPGWTPRCLALPPS